MDMSGQQNNQSPTTITRILLSATNMGLLIMPRVPPELFGQCPDTGHGSRALLVRTTNIGFWSYPVNLGMAAPSGAPSGETLKNLKTRVSETSMPQLYPPNRRVL